MKCPNCHKSFIINGYIHPSFTYHGSCFGECGNSFFGNDKDGINLYSFKIHDFKIDKTKPKNYLIASSNLHVTHTKLYEGTYNFKKVICELNSFIKLESSEDIPRIIKSILKLKAFS